MIKHRVSQGHIIQSKLGIGPVGLPMTGQENLQQRPLHSMLSPDAKSGISGQTIG